MAEEERPAREGQELGVVVFGKLEIGLEIKLRVWRCGDAHTFEDARTDADAVFLVRIGAEEHCFLSYVHFFSRHFGL